MYKAKKSLNIANAFSFNKYQSQILSLIGFMILSFASISSHALAPNLGAVCDSNFAQGSLTNNDYTSLVSNSNTGNYVTVAGNAAGSIPLQMRISTTESSTSTVADRLSVTSAPVNNSTINAINVRRDFRLQSDFTTITLDFRNSLTSQPIFLSKVALSAFDVDYSNNNSVFHDLVQIRGITQSDAINGTFQTIAGSGIINTNNGFYTEFDFNCPQQDLGTFCQGSVQFSKPVSSVIIRYANNPEFITGNPTTQQIDFRVDNYCYAPQYIFSGTVFNDNGGIDDTQADASNANITSGTYFNKPNYFNGVFNPPQESGISGSTVRLTNCANGTTYPTQSVIKPEAPTGAYQISIPKTTLGSNTNLCLVESRTGDTYPIRTTSDSIKVSGFSPTAYNYPNNNFGRVIPANAALVLRKAQFVNDCPSTLDYTASTLNTPGNTNPRTGFSESSISGSELIPGQCIAYKITATNRSNLVINDFVMQDKLQKKGVEGALVTSVLVGPLHNSSDYALNSVAIGQNNPVITKPLVLPDRDNKVFYFNTKYGTTVDP